MAGCRGKVHTQNGGVSKEEFVKKKKKWKLSKDKLCVTYGHEHGSTIVNHGHRRQVLGGNSLPEQTTHMYNPATLLFTHTWFVTLRYLYTPLLSLLNTHMVCHLKVPLHSSPPSTHTWFVTLRYLYTPLLSLLNTHMTSYYQP